MYIIHCFIWIFHKYFISHCRIEFECSQNFALPFKHAEMQ